MFDVEVIVGRKLRIQLEKLLFMLTRLERQRKVFIGLAGASETGDSFPALMVSNCCYCFIFKTKLFIDWLIPL